MDYHNANLLIKVADQYPQTEGGNNVGPLNRAKKIFVASIL